MNSGSRLFVLGLLPFAMALNTSCGKKKSQYESGKKAPPATAPAPVNPQTSNGTAPQNPATSPIPAGPAPDAPVCAANQKVIGANIAFIVDNSNSTSATDCPGAVQIGQTFEQNGAPVATYRCSAPTNREQAVLAAFDLLAQASAMDSSPAAVSNLSIVGFPGPNNAVQTVHFATNGWVSSRPAAESRTAVQSALQFTRQPMGATFYGAGLSAVSGLFGAPSTDPRARVAVLISDGEPADRDPMDVASRAQALRQAGVEVITVYVTNPQQRAAREMAHQNMLASWEQRSLPGHYYNSQRYQSFDAYLSDIFGRNGRVSLTDAVTSPVVPSCIDAPGAMCQRWKVEIQDSAGLANAVKQIIRTRAIRCQ